MFRNRTDTFSCKKKKRSSLCSWYKLISQRLCIFFLLICTSVLPLWDNTDFIKHKWKNKTKRVVKVDYVLWITKKKSRKEMEIKLNISETIFKLWFNYHRFPKTCTVSIFARAIINCKSTDLGERTLENQKYVAKI